MQPQPQIDLAIRRLQQQHSPQQIELAIQQSQRILQDPRRLEALEAILSNIHGGFSSSAPGSTIPVDESLTTRHDRMVRSRVRHESAARGDSVMPDGQSASAGQIILRGLFRSSQNETGTNYSPSENNSNRNRILLQYARRRSHSRSAGGGRVDDGGEGT